jgi:hypothetical protein
MQFGTVRGLSELIRYSFLIMNNKKAHSFEDLKILYEITAEFNNVTIRTTDLANNGSVDIVYSKLDDLIFFTSFTYVFLVYLFLFYLLPYINQEIDHENDS